MSTDLTRRRFLQAGAALAAGCAGQAPGSAAIPLFDGKTLHGWHKNPQKIGHGTGGCWEVLDGAICGEQDPPGSGNGGILLTDRTFGDFDLSLDLRPDFGVDSGLFLRSNDRGQCIQMMVDYHERGNVGHIYGEGLGGFSARPYSIRGVMQDGKLTGFTSEPLADYPAHPATYTCAPEEWIRAWRIEDWNSARVLCTGAIPRITTWINDLKVCELDLATWKHPKYDREKVAATLGRAGSIAVQVHGGKGWPVGARCRWKNFRIRELY